jgi:aspartyl-tRNA(Asn)/glutamyl-tRNA(Gln) amidotransferase subunit C
MVDVSEENLIALTRLCRIACSHEKRAALLQSFRQIVAYVDKLSEVDTTGIEPCSYVAKGHPATPRRSDTPEPSLDRELFLKNAPLSIAGLVRVPTIIKNHKES